MDLAPYLDQLRRELAVAAAAGGPDARDLAERLTAPLESAARLALLDALTAAAEEITRDLAPGSVDVRLRGRDPEFVVTPPPAEQELGEGAAQAGRWPAPATPVTAPAPAGSGEVAVGSRSEADEGGTSRITLRLPEQLKPRIERAAGEAGLSVNAWLVRAVTAAVEAGSVPSVPSGPSLPSVHRPSSALGQRFTGWVQ